MASFCKSCSIYMFGDDFGDFAHEEETPVSEICEGCGYIAVGKNGECLGGIDEPCHEHHLMYEVDYEYS